MPAPPLAPHTREYGPRLISSRRRTVSRIPGATFFFSPLFTTRRVAARAGPGVAADRARARDATGCASPTVSPGTTANGFGTLTAAHGSSAGTRLHPACACARHDVGRVNVAANERRTRFVGPRGRFCAHPVPGAGVKGAMAAVRAA